MNLYFDVLFDHRGRKQAMAIISDGNEKLYIQWKNTPLTDIKSYLIADNKKYYINNQDESLLFINGELQNWKEMVNEWVESFDDPIFITDNTFYKCKILSESCKCLNKMRLPIIDLNNFIYFKNRNMSYYDILMSDKDIVTGMLTNRTIKGDPKNPLHHAQIIKILYNKFRK